MIIRCTLQPRKALSFCTQNLSFFTVTIPKKMVKPRKTLSSCVQNLSFVTVTIPKKMVKTMSAQATIQHNGIANMFTSRKVVTHPTSTAVHTKSDPIVSVAQGRLRGTRDTLYDGSPYFSFKGIPYAQPPVGSLRFKAPLPPTPWNDIYDATEHGPVCPQLDLTTGQIIEGDENCLFLNVYTCTLTPGNKKPVMFYIHGGAYMSGSGNSALYGPEYLLQHDVVLVTINYRLETLGFLCLDTEEVPGNAGMRDQVAALKWVQKNIEKFGGDPQNVTLFGESAGSASVSFHMASPMSRGLFHKAILQSGVFTNDWTQGKDGKERAFRLGMVLNKEVNNESELLSHLRSLPAVDLTRATFKTMTFDEKHRGFPIHFAPVVEKKFDNVEPFLCQDPIDLLLQNKLSQVPVIVGYNSAEGLMALRNALKKLDFINKKPHYQIPRQIAERVSEHAQIELGKRVKTFYFGDRDITKEDMQKIATLDSDVNFNYGVHRFMHFLSRNKSPAFMYRFDFVSELNIIKSLMGFQHLKGACHGDELFYMFGSILTSEIYTDNEKVREMVRVVTKLWTNFAKTSNPTPDDSLGVIWEPYTQTSKNYLNLNESLSMGKYADQENMEFWNKLFSESGLPCITKSSL